MNEEMKMNAVTTIIDAFYQLKAEADYGINKVCKNLDIDEDTEVDQIQDYLRELESVLTEIRDQIESIEEGKDEIESWASENQKA